MNKNNIDKNFLLNLNLEENIYLLGLLWADGSIYKNNIQLEMVKTDFLDFKYIFTKFGINRIYERQRYKNNQPFGNIQCSASLHSKTITDFLIENNYDKKSWIAPTEILSKIPEQLRHYWWRGYFDGDGCLYVGTRNELAFWSTINQDWTELINLLNQLNINQFKLLKYIRYNHTQKSSTVGVRRVLEIKKFLDFIYQNYSNDKLGLTRKYNTYQKLINKIPNMKCSSTSNYNGICFNKTNKKWKATISKNKTNKLLKNIHIGWFDTEEDAILAHKNKMKELNVSTHKYPKSQNHIT